VVQGVTTSFGTFVIPYALSGLHMSKLEAELVDVAP
jgi:hypothetical protein